MNWFFTFCEKKCESPDLSLHLCWLSHLQGHTGLHTDSPAPVWARPTIPRGHQEGEALRYRERGTETLEHSSRCIKANYAGLIPWTSQIMEQRMDLKDETTKMDAWRMIVGQIRAGQWWGVDFRLRNQCPLPWWLCDDNMWHLSSSPVVGTHSITRGTSSLPEPRFTHIWKNG